jgi:hypothetical protein
VGDAQNVTVQRATGVGQKLVLHMPLHEERPISVTPAFVAQLIKFGIAAGWAPSVSGSEVLVHYKPDRFTRWA